MKDIDFDELDRAVSSVLTSNASATAATSPTAPVAAPSAPVTAPVSQPSVPSAVVASPTILASPAVRRGGRFMDVVHPSSDMKTATPVSRVPKRPLGPISSDLTTPEPAAAPVPEVEIPSTIPQAVDSQPQPEEPYPTLDTLPAESSPRIEEPVASAPVEEPADVQPATTWPDPLDIQNDATPSGVPEKQPETDIQTKDESVPESTEPAAIDTTADPTQTPFLPDTKVDKRPLGGYVDPTDAQRHDDIPSFSPSGTSSSLSPEMEADLVKIESNETEPTPEDATATAPGVVGAASSIPQQYPTNQDKFADSDAPAIFDTSSYHQPLIPQKTHRKSHTWVWVLIIVGLLIIGAVLGALFFMAGF